MRTLRFSFCVIMLTSSALAFNSNVETARDALSDHLVIPNVTSDDIKDTIMTNNEGFWGALSNFGEKVLQKLEDDLLNTKTTETNDVNEDQEEAKRESDDKPRDKRGLGVCLNLDLAGIGNLVDGLLSATGLSETLLTLLNLPKKLIDFILGLPFSLLSGLPINLLSGLNGLLGSGGLLGGLLGGKGGDLLGGGLLGGALGGKDGGLLGGALGGKEGGLLGKTLGGIQDGLLGGALKSKGGGNSSDVLGAKDGGILGGILNKGTGVLNGALASIDKAVEKAASIATNKAKIREVSVSDQGSVSVGRRSADKVEI